MGMFSGNIGNAYKGNHVFIILDPHFQSYGVGSLTKSGFTEFISTDFGREVMETRTATNIFTALSLTSDGTYRKYDKNRDSGSPYVATTISIDSLLSLIDYHESGDAQTDQKNASNDDTIKDIKNSLEGYVSFKNGSTLVLKVYLNAIGKGNNERVVTQKGSPLITAPPRTAAGRTYSARQSQKIRLEETNGFPNIGTIIDVPKDADKNDVEHTVTGPMRLSWNEVTGTWESSNQVIARLLKDLEPANIVGFELSDDDLNNTNSSTYLDKSSGKYTAQRTHGTAMPLSVQNNNPEMFGPTLIKCQGANRVEEISVVNRSNDSFKNGDIVLCSFIGGEWIVQKFGSLETKPQPTTIGRWGFTKLIANSDWYFRDTAGDLTLPASCQDLLRAKFYASLANADSAVSASIFSKQEISTLNSAGNSTRVNRTLNYYIQTTSFDNSGPTKGGTGSQDFYSRINVEQPPFGDVITYFQTPIFWGPVFPDGYSSAGHARMRANAAIFSGWKHSGLSTASSGKPIANFGDNFFANNTTKKIQDVPNLDINDSNFLQLPADIATNGQYGGDGFPIENTHKIIQAINSGNGTNSLFATSINNLINNEGFAYYLGQIDRPSDMYALKPSNALKLQFSPLCAELAGSDDANSPNLTDSYSFDRNFQKNAREPLKSQRRFDATLGEEIPASTSLFGGLYTRLAAFGISNLTTITPVTCDGVYANALVGQFQGIPYDCYIQRTPLNKPKASTFIFSSPSNPAQDGSNLVGIIAARNSFTKNKGGTMNVSVKQMFGMYGRFIGNGGSGGIAVTILGSIGAWTTDNSATFKARYTPIFGSTNNDSIDSFGTTALHCMVWDYWPEQQTIFVPQYFSVLHFNPGILFSAPRTRSGIFRADPTGPTTTAAPGSTTTTPPPINVDVADFDVDFRIPSFNLKGSDGGYVPLIDGTVVNFANTLAPEADSRINTVRRGQLVTGDGFFYYKLVVGLNKDSATITTAGAGFSVGTKIDSGKGVTIEVTSVDTNGGISGFTFAEDRTLEGKLPAGVPLSRKQGEGFKHSDFPTATPYKITLKSPTSGTSAVITFSSGRAYKQIKQDVGPKMRTPITKLSSPSGEGTARVEATKNNTLNIDDNTGSKYPNKYEAFYFFHNDIGHTFSTSEIEANPNFTQYMTMTIS
jgi:hypothetical protein